MANSLPWPDRPVIGRRRVLTLGIGAVAGFIGAALAVPIVGYVISPAFTKRATEWFAVGASSDFKPGEPTRAEMTVTRKDGWVERQESVSVWVVAGENDQVTVFHGRCTHLGCAYSWKADAKEFLCPCHTGRFAPDGKVLGGPPPRPLDTLPTKIEGGQLVVQYKNYKLGVPSKEEL